MIFGIWKLIQTSTLWVFTEDMCGNGKEPFCYPRTVVTLRYFTFPNLLSLTLITLTFFTPSLNLRQNQ